MAAHRTLLWFRQDLRLADNPALQAAMARGAVIPVYLWTPHEEAPWSPGAASRWWLHHSLHALARTLSARGAALVVRQSAQQGALDLLLALLEETGADGVCWNQRQEPLVRARDARVAHALHQRGIWTGAFQGSLLEDPAEIRNKSGKPFQVFTPYWRRAVEVVADPAEPTPAPARWPGTEGGPPLQQTLTDVDALALLPRIAWDAGMRETWQPGETGATRRLEQFCAGAFFEYDTDRNRPDLEGTSRLSPHLHFGEISPRQVWHAAASAAQRAGRPGTHRQSQFLAEIGWREFAHHQLHHFPHTPQQPLRAQFEHFPWADDPEAVEAWQRGRTGIPIVDAGMRQLWHEGWMHNRVRMIVGSLLVKNLQVNWLEGARWFWDTLVDADLANNTLGWQWVAGCGADAAPYFRVFNPLMQAAKFDPQGAYIRRWVPEVGKPGAYPPPIVNLSTSRIAALKAYATTRESR